MASYDPALVAQYFDAFGAREWTRLVDTPADEVKLHVHTHFLREHIRAGMHVLDIGAGAGRFTQLLAALGATITVADLSPGQLALNRAYANQYAFAHAVTDWIEADVCDLRAFADTAFDAVVCYGGPLSYVFERRREALAELCRVTAPGGVLLLSVMSLWGTVHAKLPGILTLDAAENAHIIATGDSRLGAADGTQHHCHMYRAHEFRGLLGATGCEVLALSASNCLSTAWGEELIAIRADAARWNELLAMEVEACAQDGSLDLGTHLIGVLRRPGRGTTDA
jgi:SAM-dependent methyltransferase